MQAVNCKTNTQFFPCKRQVHMGTITAAMHIKQITLAGSNFVNLSENKK